MCRTNISVKWFKINKWITNKRHLYTKWAAKKEKKDTQAKRRREKSTGCLHRTTLFTHWRVNILFHILHHRSIAPFVFGSFCCFFFNLLIVFITLPFNLVAHVDFHFNVTFFSVCCWCYLKHTVPCGCLYEHIKNQNSIKYHPSDYNSHMRGFTIRLRRFRLF